MSPRSADATHLQHGRASRCGVGGARRTCPKRRARAARRQSYAKENSARENDAQAKCAVVPRLILLRFFPDHGGHGAFDSTKSIFQTCPSLRKCAVVCRAPWLITPSPDLFAYLEACAAAKVPFVEKVHRKPTTVRSTRAGVSDLHWQVEGHPRRRLAGNSRGGWPNLLPHEIA
jgi:hypothetical protein